MALDPLAMVAALRRYPVVVAYRFGSQATGETTPLSDVDIAVLLEADTQSPAGVQGSLLSDMMLALHRSDIDVVVLNCAPPLLRERVISRGRLLYCRDEQVRVQFEIATRRAYFDTQPLRDAQDRALLDRYTGR